MPRNHKALGKGRAHSGPLAYVWHRAPGATSPVLSGASAEGHEEPGVAEACPAADGRAAVHRHGESLPEGSGGAPSDAREPPPPPPSGTSRYRGGERLHHLGNTSPRRLSQTLWKRVYGSRPGIIPAPGRTELQTSQGTETRGREAFPGPLSLKICCSPRS